MPDELTPTPRLADALRRIYDRPQPPVPWRDGANLPWDDPAFRERMLAQHLDPSHGAASRPPREMRAQVQQMTAWPCFIEFDISTPMAYTPRAPMA